MQFFSDKAIGILASISSGFKPSQVSLAIVLAARKAAGLELVWNELAFMSLCGGNNGFSL